MIGLLVAASFAVALHVLAFPPADVGALAFFALAPWVAVVRRLRGWRLFAAGAVMGAAILTMGCWWIACTAPINLVLMVIPESLFFGGFALLLRALTVTRAWPAFLALPVAFTGIEVLRGRWPLDGFPWLTFGYTQHGWVDLLQMATVTGVHGVTFLLALCAGAIADAVWPHSPTGRRFVPLGIAAALVAGIAAAGHFALGDPAALPAGSRLLLVQPNIEQRLKNASGSSSASAETVLDLQFRLEDEALAREPADLLVWSETMLLIYLPAEGFDRPDDPPKLREIRRSLLAQVGARVFARHRLPLLAGLVTYDGPFLDPITPNRNSAVLFDQSGKRIATYDKTVPVPGGEYLPWIDWLPDSVADDIRRRVLDLAGFLPNLQPGRRSGVVDLAVVGRTGRAGLSICFEFAYPHLGRAMVKQGADFLLNLSNEAWFADSAEFAQSTAMSVFRAVETRRTMVRCANSGTSGSIDPWGRPTYLEQEGRRHGFAGTMVVAPPLATTVTPYVRLGEWVGFGSWTAVLLAFVVRRRGPKSSSEGPGYRGPAAG